MNDIRISVIVISYNGIEFITDCLTSIVKSLQGESAEIIVVDNGSTDGTFESIKQDHHYVKLIKNQSNLGFAKAVNRGLRESKGEYIFLLNQDTRIVTRAISDLAARLAQDERIGIIGPKFVGFDGNLQKSCRTFPRYRDIFYELAGLSYLFPRSRIFSRWKMGWFDHETEKEVDQPMGAAMMFRRSLLEKVGYLDESFPIFFNDVDFCRRVKECGFVNLYFPVALVEHFVGGTIRKMKPGMIIESHHSMYRYFRKYNKSILSLPSLYFCGFMLFVSGYVRAGLHALFRTRG